MTTTAHSLQEERESQAAHFSALFSVPVDPVNSFAGAAGAT